MENATIPEVQSSTFTEFNVRQDKGKPCFIRLHDSVVRDLERLLVLGGDQPGILLGTIEAGATCTIAVEDSEPCANLEERIRTWKPRAGSRQKVVGCYRCHSRSEFGLEQADRALFQRCFPKEGRLLLQVKPPKGDVGTAMFFLGENGQLAADQATVEFPFNLRELGAEEPSAAPIPVPVAVPQPAPAKPMVVAPPPPEPVAKKAGGGMVWKIAVAGVAVVASVVGLSGLRVFDSQNTRPQPAQSVAEQPAVEQPLEPETAPLAPIPPKSAKAAPEPKTVVVTPKKVEIAPMPPVAPVRAPRTVVADNAIAKPPAPSQPVMQIPAPPPAPEAQPRTVTPVTSTPPPSPRPAPVNEAPKPTQPLTPPRVIRQTAPEVRDSVRRSITGEVIIKVRANIDATGKVISAESVSKGDPIAEALAGSAIAAVKRWQFEPAQRGPEKVPGEVVLSFTFRK